MVRSLVVGGVYVALVLVVEACSFVVAALLVVFWWSAPSSLGVSWLGSLGVDGSLSTSSL